MAVNDSSYDSGYEMLHHRRSSAPTTTHTTSAIAIGLLTPVDDSSTATRGPSRPATRGSVAVTNVARR